MSAGVLPSFWQQQLMDEAVLAYVAWRQESATVWAAYGHWSSAATDEAIRAHAAYNAALDREETAAHVYARLVGRVSELLETGV
jgi:hypothetical protein